MSITVVEVISAGPQGIAGIPGASTHPGGITKEVLMKLSDTDYDVEWANVDAADTTFTSTEDIVGTDVAAAIDEVEASRQVNETAISVNTIRGQIVIPAGTEDIDDDVIYIAGVYNVTDDHNLPLSLTSATLVIIEEVSGGTDLVTQLLSRTSDTKEYIRSKVGVGEWDAWAEVPESVRITSIEASRAAAEAAIATINKELTIRLDETTTNLNTILVSGIYDDVTGLNIPAAETSGILYVKYIDDATGMEQWYTGTSGIEYIRTSIAGDGTDWTSWTEKELSARVTTNEDDILILQTPPDEAKLNPVFVAPSYEEGKFYYDGNTGTFNIMGPFEGIEVSPGHGQHMHVINNSGALIEEGMAVRVQGVSGGIPQIVKAQADSFENANVVGVTTLEVANGESTAIAISGIVDFDTSILAAGGPYYLSDTIAGTYTKTAPAIRTEVGGVLVSDASVGKFRVDVKVNEVTPNVLGGLKGQDTPLYNVDVTTQDIVDYTLTREVVTTVNEATGEITLPNDGDYRVHFTAGISFISSTNTRTLYLELYDVTGATIHYTYAKNIPRSATEDSLSFSWPMQEIAGNVHKVRIRSNVAIDVTFESLSFDIASISIT